MLGVVVEVGGMAAQMWSAVLSTDISGRGSRKVSLFPSWKRAEPGPVSKPVAYEGLVVG